MLPVMSLQLSRHATSLHQTLLSPLHHGLLATFACKYTLSKDRAADFMLGDVSQHLDKFTSAYLRVNEGIVQGDVWVHLPISGVL